MPVTKEAGLGLVDSNSYASVADADVYFAGHLYGTAWIGATLTQQEAALVMATRLIDSQYQFRGTKTSNEQALQWPRENCPDPDAGRWSGGVVASDVIPKNVVDATCEMAKELLILDRTAAPPGEGLSYLNIGSEQTGYSKTDVRPIISHVAQAMLGKYGTLIRAKSGSVPLRRV